MCPAGLFDTPDHENNKLGVLMMTTISRSMVILVVLAASAQLLHAEQPATEEGSQEAAKISYYRDVRPIFQQHCQGCHQPAKPSGGLVMTAHAGLLKAGDSGAAAIVPGDPDESEILLQITGLEGERPPMPKEGDPLTEREIELIRKWIAQGAEDDTPATARAVVDMQHPPTYVLPPVVPELDYSPDSALLAVAGNHEVLLYKADGSELVGRLVGLSERIESVEFSPDGKLLAVTGGAPCRFGEVQVWDVAEQKLNLSLPVTYDTVYGASWSPDGSRLAFGCADNTVRAIKVESGKQVLYQGAHNDWVLDTVFSTDASHLVSVSRDRSMKLTQVATQRFVDNITSITPGALKGGLISVDRHPTKDELLVGGADGTPKIYQMYRTKKRQIGDDFNLIRAFEPMPGRIFAVKFNSDGSRFAAGSSADRAGEVRVYQSEDGKLVSKFEGQKGAVYALDYRPDGKQVASAGFDGMIRLNDPQTGKLIKEFVAVPLAPGETVTSAEP